MSLFAARRATSQVASRSLSRRMSSAPRLHKAKDEWAQFASKNRPEPDVSSLFLSHSITLRSPIFSRYFVWRYGRSLNRVHPFAFLTPSTISSVSFRDSWPCKCSTWTHTSVSTLPTTQLWSEGELSWSGCSVTEACILDLHGSKRSRVTGNKDKLIEFFRSLDRLETRWRMVGKSAISNVQQLTNEIFIYILHLGRKGSELSVFRKMDTSLQLNKF